MALIVAVDDNAVNTIVVAGKSNSTPWKMASARDAYPKDCTYEHKHEK
jgi:hypothetical protein